MTISYQGLTLEEFLKLPEEEPALEFEDGVVTQKVSPKPPHGRLQYKFAEHLDRFGEPARLGIVFTETRVTFGGRSRVPDLCFYTWARIPRSPSGEVANDFFDPPDITVEIVSPGQSVTALFRRCLWYVEQGVGIALLVDPGDRSVIAFRPGSTPKALEGSDRIDLDDILPGFELTVQELFDSLRVG